MTQFDRVLVLDNDCIALRNLDELPTSVPTPAAACHPRRRFQLCSFNFGVHVLAPSQEQAARLVRTYTTRRSANNGGEQEAWANFHEAVNEAVNELPIGFNAHRGLQMDDEDWRRVHVVHAISGSSTNRMPTFLRERIRAFET